MYGSIVCSAGLKYVGRIASVASLLLQFDIKLLDCFHGFSWQCMQILAVAMPTVQYRILVSMKGLVLGVISIVSRPQGMCLASEELLACDEFEDQFVKQCTFPAKLEHNYIFSFFI